MIFFFIQVLSVMETLKKSLPLTINYNAGYRLLETYEERAK